MLDNRENSGDRYESMSRTPIRDDVSGYQKSPHSNAPALAVPAPHSSFPRRRESRGPGWGRQQQPTAPRAGHPFSNLGVPAPAGMIGWYESMSRTPIRDDVTGYQESPHSNAPALAVSAPHSSFRRRPESRGVGRAKCSAGACPPVGSGRGVAHSTARILRTKLQLWFSSFGAPAPAGMSDWYENCLPCRRSGSQTRLSGEGMSRIGLRQRRIRPPQAICLRHDLRSIWRAGIQRGSGGRKKHTNVFNNQPRFHTLVCRRRPGCAITIHE